MQATKDSSHAIYRAAAMVGVFESTQRAEKAIDKLEQAGFELARLSIIGKESPTVLHQMGIAVAGAHARVWGERGALWNRLADSPAAVALTWVPFTGYVVAVGAIASVLVGGYARPHAWALVRMLTLAGMSPGEVSTYEAAVRGGQILMLVHAGAADAARARHLLKDIVDLRGH